MQNSHTSEEIPYFWAHEGLDQIAYAVHVVPQSLHEDLARKSFEEFDLWDTDPQHMAAFLRSVAEKLDEIQ